MTQIDKLITALADERGLCGYHEPAMQLASIDNLEERLRLLTVGSLLDVFPSSHNWSIVAQLGEHWLANVETVAYASVHDIEPAFRALGIQGPRHQLKSWWHVARGFQGRFEGSIRVLLAAYQDTAQQLIPYLEQSKTTFPVLSGPTTIRRWLDLIHRVGRIDLRGWEELRVALPDQLTTTARIFNIAGTAHPQVMASLGGWHKGCQQLSQTACALVDCPKHAMQDTD